MLAMPQMRAMKTEPGLAPGTIDITYEGAPSPRELLENVVIQATAALKGLQATLAPQEEEATDLTQSLHAPPLESSSQVADDQNIVALEAFW